MDIGNVGKLFLRPGQPGIGSSRRGQEYTQHVGRALHPFSPLTSLVFRCSSNSLTSSVGQVCFCTFHPVESPSCIGSAVVSLTLCRLAVPLNVARLKTPSTWTPRLHVGKRDLRSDQPGMVRLLLAASIFSFRHHVVAAVYISSSTHFYRYHADR